MTGPYSGPFGGQVTYLAGLGGGEAKDKGHEMTVADPRFPIR